MFGSLSPRREGALVPTSDRFPRSFVRFEEEMEEMIQRMFGGMSFMPTADVAENEREFLLSMDLPGVKSEDVHVELQDRDLCVMGERKEEMEEEGKTFHRSERRYGEFRRVFPLPKTVDEEHIDATFKDGVLSIRVPKTEEAKPKHVEVKT